MPQRIPASRSSERQRSALSRVLLALVTVALMAAVVLAAELGWSSRTDVQFSLAAAAAFLAGVAATFAAAGSLHAQAVPAVKRPRRRRPQR